jgi:hypothetical protein
MNLAQTIFYVVSPLVTLLAVSVAYIALVRQSRPHVLVHYRPNSGIPSMIDLVVENLGGGLARNLKFSEPLPSQCWGIDKPVGKGGDVLGDGLPALASGQQMIFDAGQYGGLEARLGNALEIKISYSYRNPIGINRKRTESCVLSVSHIQNMPTRISADQAIVEALKGPNKTTVQEIKTELQGIKIALEKIHSSQDSNGSETDA